MKKNQLLTGLVLNEQSTLTLGEFSCACTMHAEWVIELVAEGILEPVADNRNERSRMCFPASSLARARRVMRLQRDLGINLSGAALALELMDEIDALRARLRIVVTKE
jgi:chaperone modulatory protein CbpM